MNIAVTSTTPTEEPSSAPGRKRYTVKLSQAPDARWERHLQDAHTEKLHSIWFPFDIVGDMVSFHCPPADLEETLARLRARVADANARA